MSTRFLLFLAAILVTCSTIAHCAVDDYTDEDHDEEVEPEYDPSTDTDETQCGPNEFFDCGSACDTTCATLGDVCPIVNIKCNEMCYCVGGYARDKNNVCIPIKQCPPKFTCARNQTYDACPYTCPPEETCESHLSGIAFSCAEEPEPRTCVPKCKCSAGFLRKVNGGDCIKPNQCCNDPNAEIVSCPNPCPGGTCIAPAFANCKAPCKIRGCQCKSGYVKDANGKCILLSKCRCGDPNSELVSCPNPCPGGTCDQPEFSSCQNVTCKPFGCQCKRGYVKDSRGKCIPVASCPRKCNINEVWNKCPGYCTFDKDCSALLGDLPMCAPPPPDYVCSPRCECIENYVRINGTCAPRQKCCEDPNSELVECPNPCPGGTCDSPQFADCDAPCKLLGCQCKNGYVLDQNKKCIPLDKCPPKVCNRNEFYNPCPKHCEFETNCLMIFDARIPSCPPPPPTPICQPRCQCLSGFVRINDECADFDACCNDPNAVITPCPMDCPETCEGIPPAPCQINCVFNSCKCKPGYVKHNGMCILREDCPKCTNPNEIYYRCIPCIGSCTNKNPLCNKMCVNGCSCKQGYIKRNETDSTCILESDCPPECPPNEFYNNCGTECPPTCGNRIPRCSKMCSQGCFCKDGYIRRFEGAECIPIEKCPITPIPRQCVQNEVFRRCPSPCPPEKTCDSMFLGVEPLCPVQLNPPICNPSCLCVSGYVRNHNNACVLPEKCCTDPNSELVDNPNCCPGGTCAQPEFSPCKRMCPAKGCQCKKGFLKKSDTDSTCVPKSCNCAKLCTKPNEKFYSCKPCVPSCTDKNPVCVAACIEGCACQPGYVRKSDSDSTCILEKNCPKLCTKPNEKYYTCKPCVPSCTNKNPMCAAACLEGCACQPGYVRKSDSDSTCILEKNCPPVCTRQNEQYYDCKPCTQLCRDVSPPCLEICIPGCDCKPGFFKNTDNGNLCVELDDCTCGQNEVFRGCPARCPPEPSCAAMFRVDQEPCTNRSSTACYHDCACKPNYVRNDLKLCVLPQKCCTDPNSELVSKPSCCPGGTCANPKFNNFCRMACPEKGCQCKKGFLKISDENKKCIPVKDCPKYP